MEHDSNYSQYQLLYVYVYINFNFFTTYYFRMCYRISLYVILTFFFNIKKADIIKDKKLSKIKLESPE